MRNKYINDSLLTSILKQINIISHDYTQQLRHENNKIHIIANMNNKYIYASLVSIYSIMRNSFKNRKIYLIDLKEFVLVKLHIIDYYLLYLYL